MLIYRVRITIGARQESETLAKVISNAIGPCQQDRTYTPPDINGFFQPAFTIDWCNVSMVMQKKKLINSQSEKTSQSVM